MTWRGKSQEKSSGVWKMCRFMHNHGNENNTNLAVGWGTNGLGAFGGRVRLKDWVPGIQQAFHRRIFLPCPSSLQPGSKWESPGFPSTLARPGVPERLRGCPWGSCSAAEETRNFESGNSVSSGFKYPWHTLGFTVGLWTDSLTPNLSFLFCKEKELAWP